MKEARQEMLLQPDADALGHALGCRRAAARPPCCDDARCVGRWVLGADAGVVVVVVVVVVGCAGVHSFALRNAALLQLLSPETVNHSRLLLML
jgi:hypothetical protein